MKTVNFICGMVVLAAGADACNRGESRFLNLSTGQNVELVKDSQGRMVDRQTNKPVVLYVDTKANDTFYGPTGARVNGHLQYVDKGVYVYNDGDRQIKIDGDEYKLKDGDLKIKGDLDGGEYKYEDGDVKVKRDEDYKVKGNGYTKKVDEDGDVKIETKNRKIKIDGETGRKTVKKRSILGKVKDKVIGD